MINYWLRRKWLDGRMGHVTYMMFALTLVNFILIAYRFLIEKDVLFQNMFSNLWVFGLIVLITYIPISILIGFWHRRTQLSTELVIKYLESPVLSKMFRVWLDTEREKINEEEIEEFREFLLKIERNK